MGTGKPGGENCTWAKSISPLPPASGSCSRRYLRKVSYRGGMMYSSAIDASGKFGAKESCWNVVKGPICAVASAMSSSVVDAAVGAAFAPGS